MVKIIDPDPQPQIVKIIDCRSCGVKLSYVPYEVQKISGKDYGGGPDGKEFIICPNCGREVTIRSW